MIRNSGANLKLTEKVWEVRTGIKAVFSACSGIFNFSVAADEKNN